MLRTPVLFLVFNRPHTTQVVFEAIRKQQPTELFIAADGPRHEEDRRNGDAVKEMILANIDWHCTVKTLFRETNLGCGRSVSSAISWFFEQVEEGIILEDDCVPNDSFFQFCQTLLEIYRDDPRISAISGNNFQAQQPMPLEADYYFSIFPSSWGWATWRRAWTGFDLHLTNWPAQRRLDLGQSLFREKKYAYWWRERFDSFFRGKLEHTWDFQFHYLSMMRRQYAILPKANLISNIGHGPDATHFMNPDSPFMHMPTYELNVPLKHPASVSRHYEADLYHQQLLFGELELVGPMKRLKRLVKRIIRYNQPA